MSKKIDSKPFVFKKRGIVRTIGLKQCLNQTTTNRCPDNSNDSFTLFCEDVSKNIKEFSDYLEDEVQPAIQERLNRKYKKYGIDPSDSFDEVFKKIQDYLEKNNS